MLIIIFILGTVCVSFAMCQANRLVNQISNCRRSICDQCHQQLKWWQLIPILGYLLQRGRCVNCYFSISAAYPISELLGGIFFIYLFIFLPKLIAIRFFFLLVWLLVLTLEDLYTQTVHFKLLVSGGCSILLIFVDRIFNMTLTQIGLWIIITGSLSILSLNNYFGWADTYLISLFGILFSPFVLLLIILTASCGALIALKLSRQIMVPFIPWLFIGIIIALSLNPLLNCHLNLI